ncbi:hypothetical protein [Flavobacterium gawalongense]|uniref:hypothetical protein n=1 Tax=Flavobacterium gawalongense TaxID=2594432 RepID=UPI001195EE9B|nr:hypothetical protein [Flavobacterium gawalongense]TRX02258.1 hypothetical protein FNW33_07235 [Flavobacterium gawalongense]
MTIALSISALSWVFGGFETFKYVLIVFGFFISILIKEVNSKNEYLFYYNNGISKLKLLTFSFLMNIVFSMLFILVINLMLQLI